MRRAFPALIAAGGLLTGAAPVHAGSALALAKQQGCLGCHAAGTKLVGPAYQDVAARYKDQPDAVAMLVKSIREGGSGKWGEIAMPPQAQLSPAQARQLASWVLGGAK